MIKRCLKLFCIFLLVSCSAEDKQVKKDVAEFELKQSSFSQLNGWQHDEFQAFGQALKGVCRYFDENNLTKLKSSKFEYSLKEYRKHCHKIEKLTDDNKLKIYIERNFIPFSVLYYGSDEGKFTSYYEAGIRASFTKDKTYKYPIYGKPNDLIEINLRDFDRNLPSQRLVGRVQNGKLIKYYTREEIEAGKLDAPIILWGDDPVDIYIMQIQGSAIATLPNGREVRVGYADNNGHRFKGIGSILLERGLIKRKDSSMPKIKKWLKENTDEAHKNMLLNRRFIFHKIVDAEGPIGAMGIPLVAGRSLAVDRRFIPLGSMMWLETKDSDGNNIHKMVMAEDVGSAIKGAVRGDYFWGHGEEALYYAGRMNAKGRYFILVPKNTEVKFYERGK